MTELQSKAKRVRDLTAELVDAQQHLKECSERTAQAREKLDHLRDAKNTACDELMQEVLGPELAKTKLLFWS
jgi:septation ring formation regulator EzrA